MAQEKAIDTHPLSVETKQNWARIAAYVSQVINSITKTYDEAEIVAKLEELEQMIKQETTKEERTP